MDDRILLKWCVGVDRILVAQDRFLVFPFGFLCLSVSQSVPMPTSVQWCAACHLLTRSHHVTQCYVSSRLLVVFHCCEMTCVNANNKLVNNRALKWMSQSLGQWGRPYQPRTETTVVRAATCFKRRPCLGQPSNM
jgi:hypothetical protein